MDNRTTIGTALRLTLVSAVALASAATVAVPAQAKGGNDGRVEASGTCSGGGVWKLKAKHDDGRIEYEFEVDANRVGQAWRVRITDNGSTVFSGTRTTLAPSGSFSVERTTADRAGRDTIVATATRGSARCHGSVAL